MHAYPNDIPTDATDDELEGWAMQRHGMRALLSCLLAGHEPGSGYEAHVEPRMADFLAERQLVEKVQTVMRSGFLVHRRDTYVRFTPRGRRLAEAVRIPGYPEPVG